MAFLRQITSLVQDPPPAFAFELSEAGLAFAKIGVAPEIGFEPFEADVLSISPVHDNVHRPEAIQERIAAFAPANGKSKRRAALIVPDYAARLAILDFDSFPSSAEEQLALVRFRMRKSVPFDIDAAQVRYFAQPRVPREGGTGGLEVLVAVIALEILTRYEAPFRALGFQPGHVTTSTLAMMNLLAVDGISLVAKVCGKTITALVLDQTTVRLSRCVQMDGETTDDIETVLHPTLAYIEDELQTTPKRLVLGGFGPDGGELGRKWASEWGVTVEPLQSRLGAPTQYNAGLLGYLEGLQD